MSHLSALAHRIWDMKYRLKTVDGEPVDGVIADTHRRVARALAAVERDPAQWEAQFFDALSDFRLLPAGRILAGAGSDRAVTLFNCFVMGSIPDSLGAIFDHLREAAMTLQQGGGIGYDFSTLRPRGAPVHGVGADASGPLSFMEVWDAMCRTIMSAGARRGAMMGCLRVDHPDIEAFIEAKSTPGHLTNFNLSVLVPDAFMAAVEADDPWDLVFGDVVYGTVSARRLWERIMRATYQQAEPGVIFIDRINQRNNLAYCETISATNPCGEQPLPPYGTCLLGSVNLARLVLNPFTPEATLDEDSLVARVTVAVRLLDNVIDVSRYPLGEQGEEARNKRRIGLGVTGLADALIQCGVRYGSQEAAALTEHWLGTLRNAAYAASVALAREKGPFPLFDAERYLAGETLRSLPRDLQAAIGRHGIRNALLTSIAPTGTISLLADNISSGIEPVFSFEHRRRVRENDGRVREETISNYSWRLYRRLKGEDAPLTDAFVIAEDLTPAEHVRMQAAAQHYIDSAISKTINVPADIPFEAFQNVYRLAYDSGCKGCTTYRPNAITGAVLTHANPDNDTPRTETAPAPVAPPEPPLERPQMLPGATYKLRWPESDHAIYITLNDVEDAGGRRPFEVFINSKNMEHYAWTVALTRMISAVFRRGGDVSFVVEELKAVFDPRGGHWMQKRYVPSLLAAIGGVIEEHMRRIGFLFSAEEEQAAAVLGPDTRPCPRCGAPTLTRQEGCDTCLTCGYSKCS